MFMILLQFTKRDRREYIGRIHKFNTSLTFLVNRPLSLEVGAYKSHETKAVRRYYKRVQNHAEILSTVLEEKLQTSGCLCQVRTLYHF